MSPSTSFNTASLRSARTGRPRRVQPVNLDGWAAWQRLFATTEKRGSYMNEQLNPEKILQTGMAFWASKTLLSAVEMGVFTELAHPLHSPL